MSREFGRGEGGTGRADGRTGFGVMRLAEWLVGGCMHAEFAATDLDLGRMTASHVGQMVQYGTRIYDRSLRILTRTRQVYRPEKQVGHKTLNML